MGHLTVFAGQLAALGLLVSTASAASAADAGRPAHERPAIGGASADALAQDFTAGLAAIMSAEIAAQDKLAVDAANPFRKPRPRPDREHLMAPQANALARGDTPS